jgi:hypothetical protein
VSWREHSREIHRGRTYITLRCAWCGRWQTVIDAEPTACSCNSVPTVKPPTTGPDPGRWRWP